MCENWKISEDIKSILLQSKKKFIPKNKEELHEMSLGGKGNKIYHVEYCVNGKNIREATVTKCKNGIAVNYETVYLRRRDPDCLFIGDENYSDKPKLAERFNVKFKDLKMSTIEWLKEQEIIVMPFKTGNDYISYNSLFIGPKNAAFFASALADLQTMLEIDKVPDDYKPEIVLILAPPFRYTHFNEKQVVVHNRQETVYEIFSYNLYPGPSAKKGLYGALLFIGEKEKWLTLHSSSVKVKTPYDNTLVILHEGASGGGKSEMNEEFERLVDGRIVLAENIITKEKIYVYLKEESKIYPVSDDMTICHPKIQKNNGKLTIFDAEKAWFVRVDHIKHYGTNIPLEKITIHPKRPILFLNIYAVPDATCLIWEHIEDEPGIPCPNPRVILPRENVEDVVNEPVEVDYRSFGFRTSPTFIDSPGYGVYGFMHVLPPALAWLYRLAAPRGYDNPSIVKTKGLSSEGIGTYGPFMTGSIINHANLLLEQFIKFSKTQYVLFPNQHIGAYRVGFMPQWIGREYLARRGSRPFLKEELIESKHPILGYTKKIIKVEDIIIPDNLLRVELQKEVGEEVFDNGAKIIYEFFKNEILKYKKDNLSQLGNKIIECFLDNGKLEDYENLIK